MSPDDPLGKRQPPRFVPTLTEVVDGVAADINAGLTASDSLPVAPLPTSVNAPAVMQDAMAYSSSPLAHPTASVLPVEAMVDNIVEHALDELLARLADRLELHLASRMAQWRNEQAQQWVLQWLHAEMDGQLSDVRVRMEQLARELIRKNSPQESRK